MKKRFGFILAVCQVLVIATLLSGCSSQNSSSAATGSALDKVLKSGTLTVAVFSDVPPWGFQDANHQPTGLDVDVANAMGKALGVKVEFVSTTNANRIPYLQTKKVDCVVASFTMNAERRKVVDFSMPYIVSGATLIINSKSASSASIKSIDDLKGKTIAVAKGSLNDELATSLAGKTAKDILRFDNVSDVFQALELGKADVVIEDVTAIYIIKDQHPDFKAVGSLLSADYEGIGIYPGDQRWLNWVNGFVEFNLLRNGQMKDICSKYGIIYSPVNSVY